MCQFSLLNTILHGLLMPKFSLYNPFYGPIGSKCSVNKILHGPFMLKLSVVLATGFDGEISAINITNNLHT